MIVREVSWRYLPGGRVTHAVREHELTTTRATALCGVGWWNPPSDWSEPVGEEITHGVPLRQCRRCLAVQEAAARGGEE